MVQQRPDKIGVPEPDQSNCRPCLSLGQRILALFRVRSVFTGDRTSGDLGLERGESPGRLALYGREETHIRLVTGSHEQFGQHVGIVAGVVGEDGRGKVPFALGSPRVPEDRGQWSQKPLPDWAHGLDQRRVIPRIPDHGRQELVGDERRYGFPAILDSAADPALARAQAARKRFSGSDFGSSSKDHSRSSIPGMCFCKMPQITGRSTGEAARRRS